MSSRALLAAVTAALVFTVVPASAQDAKPAPRAVEAVAADPAPAEKPTGTTVAPDDDLLVRYPPPGARWRALVAGAGMTLVAYGGAAIMGAGWDQVPGSDMLFVPIAGPWVALGQSGCAPEEETTPGEGDCGALMGLRGVLFVVDGLLQAAGLAIVGEGIFMTTAEPDAPPKAAIMPMPIVTEHSLGIGVIGTF